MITMKSFSLKTLFLVFTICVFIAGGATGWLIGRYQGASDLAFVLKEHVVVDGILQDDDYFTLGSNEQYYIVQENFTKINTKEFYDDGAEEKT